MSLVGQRMYLTLFGDVIFSVLEFGLSSNSHENALHYICFAPLNLSYEIFLLFLFFSNKNKVLTYSATVKYIPFYIVSLGKKSY